MIKRKIYAFRDSAGKEVRYSDRRDAERMANGAKVYEVEVEEQTTTDMIHELVSTSSSAEIEAIAANVAPKSWKKNISIQQFIKTSGMTHKELSDRFGIPKRTIEDWSRGARKCPDYVVNMMSEILDK